MEEHDDSSDHPSLDMRTTRRRHGSNPGASASRAAYPGAFREVPRTGVIYVTTEATRRGYRPTTRRLVQPRPGQARDRALPGAPPRIEALPDRADDQEYAPVAGLWELREAIAGFYNELFRRGMRQQVLRRERRGLRRRPRRR